MVRCGFSPLGLLWYTRNPQALMPASSPLLSPPLLQGGDRFSFIYASLVFSRESAWNLPIPGMHFKINKTLAPVGAGALAQRAY